MIDVKLSIGLLAILVLAATFLPLGAVFSINTTLAAKNAIGVTEFPVELFARGFRQFLIPLLRVQWDPLLDPHIKANQSVPQLRVVHIRVADEDVAAVDVGGGELRFEAVLVALDVGVADCSRGVLCRQAGEAKSAAAAAAVAMRDFMVVGRCGLVWLVCFVDLVCQCASWPWEGEQCWELVRV